VTDSHNPAHEDELRAELQSALDREASGAPPLPEEPVEDVAASDPEWADGPEASPVLVEAPPAATPDLPYADEDDESEEPTARNRRLQSGLEWVAVIVGALVVALIVKTFLFQAFYIPSASMEPTLEKGDRVLVNKISYDLHDVNRGDVIVFELDPEDVGPDGIKDLIKRVVGLPGDVIESRDGIVFVNDRALDEPYLADGMITGDPDDARNPPIEKQTVPDGHVFVLGDNRSNSADSRYPYRGPIPIDSIVGRAFVLVWPPADIGTL
jgi:signal peptidase I